jgi:CHAD domain-containing protein
MGYPVFCVKESDCVGKRCRLGAEAARAGIMGRVFVIEEQVERVRQEDPEGIHDMRVASRRLRAALSDFGQLLPKKACKAFREDARTITQLLGEPRELDVMLAALAGRQKRSKGPTKLAYTYGLRKLRATRKSLSPQCQQAADLAAAAQFQEHVQALVGELGELSKCYVKQARKNLVRRFVKLCNGYDAWRQTGEEEQLHALRIAFKKFRYACELYATLYGDSFNAFIKKLKITQEILGDWNDCRTLRNAIERIAKEAPPKSAAGFPKIISGMKRQCQGHEETFRLQARRFFAKNGRKAVEDMLGQPIQPCCVPKTT